MVEIYAINIQEMMTSVITDNDMKGISSERRERIHRLKFINDKKASFFAETLIHFYMKNVRKQFEYNFVIDDTGKPRFSNIDNLHFNISHSGDWVICAFSDYEIGVDIEKIRDVDLDLARKYYHVSEYKKIIYSEKNSKQRDLFCLLWTLKESYLKNSGIGIKGLKPQIRFELGKCIIGYDDGWQIDRVFYTERFEKDYYVSICYDKNEIINRQQAIHILSYKQLLEMELPNE